MATEQQVAELLALWEKYADGTMGRDEAARLESLAKSDPALLRLFVDTSHQHACLATNPDVAVPRSFDIDLKAFSEIPISVESKSAGSCEAALFRAPVRGGLLRIAALLVAGLGLGYILSATLRSTAVSTIATLTETAQCQWAGGTLPTEQGARLMPGRLRLASGLATITFSSGASVALEGPADLELLSPMKCRLHSGLVVAHVPKQAANFEIETPKAKIFDLGTQFALSVNPQGNTQVRVIDGLVEAQPNRSSTRYQVRGGEAARIDSELGFRREPESNGEMTAQVMQPAETLSGRTVRISTADRNGQDAYISRLRIANHESDTLLLVKACCTERMPERRVYLSFDLSGIRKARIEQATLKLTLAPSGFGTGAGLPDSVFRVYGVTDEALDFWSADSINWTNAPANLNTGGVVNPVSTICLGRFTVPRGVQSGSVKLNGRELNDFLNADGNGRVTLIVVRETTDTPAGTLVHAFTSRRHPGAQPPTLHLTLADDLPAAGQN